jgi:hypothetical protein
MELACASDILGSEAKTMIPDLILEGVRPAELEALSKIAAVRGYWPSPALRLALLSKGWIDQMGDHLLVTITGRTLLDARV